MAERRTRGGGTFGGPFTPEEEQALLARRDQAVRTTGQPRFGGLVWFMLTVLGVAVFLVVLMVLLFTGGGVVGQTEQAPTTRGDFGGVEKLAFIDPRAQELMRETHQLLTDECTPTDMVVLNQIAFGTEAQTSAQWDLIKASVAAKCVFYGLEAAEFRSATDIGVADICQGQVKVALQQFRVNNDLQFPADFNARFDEVYDIWYPLNIWFKRAFATSETVRQVVTGLITNAIADDDFDAERLAKAFCNQYFATDDLTYYEETKQPWLGFPFPGTQQREGSTSVGGRARTALGNISLQTEQVVKKVYIFGDTAAVQPAARLFIDATTTGVPVVEFVTGDPDSNLASVLDEIRNPFNGNFDSAESPVFVLGRYAQNVAQYKSFEGFGPSVLYGITDGDPAGVLTIPIESDVRSTAAPGSFSTLDFTTRMPYEADLGEQYSRELDVAEIINIVISGQVAITATCTNLLADTYALKNVIINGVDVGGRADIEAAEAERTADGVALGFVPLAYGLQLQTDFVMEPAFGASIPIKYDFRTDRPECVSAIGDQGSCACCWNYAAMESMGMRFCKEGKTSKYEPISIQHGLSCTGDPTLDGCIPNHPFEAYKFMATQGVLEEACVPYENAGSSTEKPCMKQCRSDIAQKDFDRYTSIVNSGKQISNSDTLKAELVANGPFPVGLAWPKDTKQFFASNPNGVYDNEFPAVGQGHLVTLVGYDDTAPVPFWILRNQWGTKRADGGYVRFAQDLPVRAGVLWIEDNGFPARTQNIATVPGTDPLPQDGGAAPPLIINDDEAAVVLPVPPPVSTPDPDPSTAPARLAPAWAALCLVVLFYLYFV